MFANKFTLHRKDYASIKNTGNLFQSTNFGVLVKSHETHDNPRFGIVISNKVSKLATHRNRIRRAFRDVLRHNWKKVDDRLDLVFLIKPGIEKVMVSDIMKEVEIFLDDNKYNPYSTKN